MSRSFSAKSARSAHTPHSARSVYSTRSHLLSPGATNESLHSDAPGFRISQSPSDHRASSPTPSRPRATSSGLSRATPSRPARVTSPYWVDKKPPSSYSRSRAETDASLSTASPISASSRPRESSNRPPESASSRTSCVRSVSSKPSIPRSGLSRSSLPQLDRRTSPSHGTLISDTQNFERTHRSGFSQSSRHRVSKLPKKTQINTPTPAKSSPRPSQRSAVSSKGSVRKRYAPARLVVNSVLSPPSVRPDPPSLHHHTPGPRVPSTPRPRSVTESYRQRLLSAARSIRPASSAILGANGLTAGSFVSDNERDHYDRDILNEVIMAIDMDKDGKVGCAYYSAIDEILFLEEDITMGGIETVETLILHVEPTSVFIPNRAPTTLAEYLERDTHRFDDDDGGDQTSSGEQGTYIMRQLPSVQFDYEVAREILAEVDLEPSISDPLQVETTQEETAQHIGSASYIKLARLARIINLDSCLSIGCAGAVLGDLDRRRNADNSNSGDDGTTSFRIRTIKMNTSADTMLVSADSLISLQITRSELHPNPQLRCSNGSEPIAKGSFSIVGLLQALASTAQGKRRLRQILLRPSTSFDVIQERQAAIGILSRLENAESTKTMRKVLRKLKDTRALLLHVRKGVDRVRGDLSVRIRDWEALLRFVMVAVNLDQIAEALHGADEVAILHRIYHEIDLSKLIAVSKVIMETFDFQASKDSNHTHIFPTASECLGELERQYLDVVNILPEFKDAQLQEVPESAHKHIIECTIMKQMGFMVAVTRDPETGEGLYNGHDEDEWEKVLTSETAVFYKSRYMRELTSQYGDLLASIADEEVAIIMEVAELVLEQEELILCALELYGELDSLLALAAAAEKYQWVAPRMTTSNVIDIVDGRHPLQELLVPTFIPNSCKLEGGRGNSDDNEGGEGESMVVDEVCSSGTGNGSPSMLILTGPNNSGKSVYMKQVALIVYLAHTGSFVPATQATIGLTDRILTRIATRETVIDDASAFMVDVKQAAFAMNFATRRSLLLIDEFGKGTTAENGAGLLTAYLLYFLELGVDRPKVLVGTHFHEIFEAGLLEDEEGVALAHMEVRLDREARDIEDQITFLHRLLPGWGSSSLGVMCAELNGIPSDILDRADDIVELLDANEDLVAMLEQGLRQKTAETRSARMVVKRFLEIPKSVLRDQAENVRAMLREIIETGEGGGTEDYEYEDEHEEYNVEEDHGETEYTEIEEEGADYNTAENSPVDSHGPLGSDDAMHHSDVEEEGSSNVEGVPMTGTETSEFEGCSSLEDAVRPANSNKASQDHAYKEAETVEDVNNFEDIMDWSGTQDSHVTWSVEDTEGSGDIQDLEDIHYPDKNLEVDECDEVSEEFEDSEIFEDFEEMDASTNFEGFESIEGSWGFDKSQGVKVSSNL